MMTFKQFDQEMIFFLQRYLRIDTSQPNPDYFSVCALFKKQAEHDKFLYNEIILPSGKPVIIITHQGSNPSLPSLILNHHMDVVPALNTEKWITPPFAGSIGNNLIIGRGTQDMKGVGTAHYYALKELINAGEQCARTIHIVVVPDEEIGGFTGTKQFLETDFFKTMNVGFIIDEGVASGNKQIINIKVTERKPLQITITVAGDLAHGSKLNCFNAIHELIDILNTLVILHKNQQEQSAIHAEGLLLSMNVTSLTAGIRENSHLCLNIVPDSASATLDIRIPPTMRMHEITNLIENILQKHTHSSYHINATVPDQQYENSYETPLYNSMVQTIQHYGLASQPLFFEGASDLRYYKALNIDGIGLTPFTTSDMIHCTNESLPISDFIQGKNIITHFLKNFCIKQKESHD